MPVNGTRVTTPWLYALTGEVQSFSAKTAFVEETATTSHQQLRLWRGSGQMGMRCFFLVLLLSLPLYGDIQRQTFISKGLIEIDKENHGILLPVRPVGLLVQSRSGPRFFLENDILKCTPKGEKYTQNGIEFNRSILSCSDGRELVVTGIIYDGEYNGSK